MNSDGKATARFRKRDKLYFYGKKMLRTVRGSIQASKSEINMIRSKKFYKLLPKGYKRKKTKLKIKQLSLFGAYFRILSRKNKDTNTLIYRNEPPQFLLDFDSNETYSKNNNLPAALINLIRSVKFVLYLALVSEF